MSETETTTEIVETEQTTTEMGDGSALSDDALRAELEETRKALKKANSEAAKRRKQLDAHAAAEQERKDAELSEVDRLKKQLTEMESEATRLKLDSLKRTIAEEVGLPSSLASRLQGDDADAIREDATKLLESLPKSKAPTIKAVAPGDNAGQVGETKEQQRARIYGSGVDTADPAWAAKHGGGVLHKS